MGDSMKIDHNNETGGYFNFFNRKNNAFFKHAV